MERSNIIQDRNTAISVLSVKRNRGEWRRLVTKAKARRGAVAAYMDDVIYCPSYTTI